MKKRMIKKPLSEQFENVDRAVKEDATATDTVATIDLVTKDAYSQSIKNQSKKDEIMTELSKTADEAKLAPKAEEPEIKEDTIYTKKHILDESLEDVNWETYDWANYKPEAGDKGGEDGSHYLDFNMQDFMSRLFTHTGGDSSMVPRYPEGVKPKEYDIGVMDGVLSLYASPEDIKNDRDKRTEEERVAAAFAPAKAACELYQFAYREPVRISYKYSRNPRYAMRIVIPSLAPDMPMMVADYFEDIGMPLDVPMKSEWVDRYNAEVAREERELAKYASKRK